MLVLHRVRRYVSLSVVRTFPDDLLAGECFVCPGCESTKISCSSGHKPIHGLVRCALPHDDMAKAADLERPHSRIDALAAKLEVFQWDSVSRFEELGGSLEAMQVVTTQEQDSLNARLERIESLLSTLVSRL